MRREVWRENGRNLLEHETASEWLSEEEELTVSLLESQGSSIAIVSVSVVDGCLFEVVYNARTNKHA